MWARPEGATCQQMRVPSEELSVHLGSYSGESLGINGLLLLQACVQGEDKTIKS